MKTGTIKRELETFLPMLSIRQQEIILLMVKNILHVDSKEQRLTKEQYNKKLEAAEKKIDGGHHLTQQEVEKKLGQWK